MLIFGRTGQVATELARLRPDATFLGRDSVDLTTPGACADAIRAHAPEVVINAAAFTGVDKAEEDEDTARLINAEAPAAMARACAEMGVPLIHISTDYVFDGSGTTPWRPGDAPAPLGAYGRTKLEGEEAVRDTAGTHAILRTAWVFSAHGGNFVKSMLRLSETKNALSIVDDQVGGPTPADAISRACLTIAERLGADPALTGTYHFAGAPETSWKGFAEAIFARADRQVAVTGIPTAEYPTPAARPLNSRLDCGSTEAAFGIAQPDWRAGLDRVLAELGALRTGDTA